VADITSHDNIANNCADRRSGVSGLGRMLTILNRLAGAGIVGSRDTAVDTLTVYIGMTSSCNGSFSYFFATLATFLISGIASFCTGRIFGIHVDIAMVKLFTGLCNLKLTALILTCLYKLAAFVTGSSNICDGFNIVAQGFDHNIIFVLFAAHGTLLMSFKAIYRAGSCLGFKRFRKFMAESLQSLYSLLITTFRAGLCYRARLCTGSCNGDFFAIGMAANSSTNSALTVCVIRVGSKALLCTLDITAILADDVDHALMEAVSIFFFNISFFVKTNLFSRHCRERKHAHNHHQCQKHH